MVADVRLEYVDVAVFTAETQDKYAAGVRMLNQICENLSGVFLIVAHLRAAIRMREGGDAVDVVGLQCLCAALNGTGNIVHAADCRNNPDLVANTNLAVRATIALKIQFIRRGHRHAVWLVGVRKKIPQTCLYIVCVYPCTAWDVLFCNSDWRTILDNRLSGTDIGKCEFMSLRDVLF